ncbi:hypothetical protein BE21_19295, partial [Sorangium cellulosum]
AVATTAVDPMAVGSGRALGRGALTPSPGAAHGGRGERDGPSLAAITDLDDVTRALERVLVRELRRHGVKPEDP